MSIYITTGTSKVNFTLFSPAPKLGFLPALVPILLDAGLHLTIRPSVATYSWSTVTGLIALYNLNLSLRAPAALLYLAFKTAQYVFLYAKNVPLPHLLTRSPLAAPILDQAVYQLARSGNASPEVSYLLSTTTGVFKNGGFVFNRYYFGYKLFQYLLTHQRGQGGSLTYWSEKIKSSTTFIPLKPLLNTPQARIPLPLILDQIAYRILKSKIHTITAFWMSTVCCGITAVVINRQNPLAAPTALLCLVYKLIHWVFVDRALGPMKGILKADRTGHVPTVRDQIIRCMNENPALTLQDIELFLRQNNGSCYLKAARPGGLDPVTLQGNSAQYALAIDSAPTNDRAIIQNLNNLLLTGFYGDNDDLPSAVINIRRAFGILERARAAQREERQREERERLAAELRARDAERIAQECRDRAEQVRQLAADRAAAQVERDRKQAHEAALYRPIPPANSRNLTTELRRIVEGDLNIPNIRRHIIFMLQDGFTLQHVEQLFRQWQCNVYLKSCDPAPRDIPLTINGKLTQHYLGVRVGNPFLGNEVDYNINFQHLSDTGFIPDPQDLPEINIIHRQAREAYQRTRAVNNKSGALPVVEDPRMQGLAEVAGDRIALEDQIIRCVRRGATLQEIEQYFRRLDNQTYLIAHVGFDWVTPLTLRGKETIFILNIHIGPISNDPDIYELNFKHLSDTGFVFSSSNHPDDVIHILQESRRLYDEAIASLPNDPIMNLFSPRQIEIAEARRQNPTDRIIFCLRRGKTLQEIERHLRNLHCKIHLVSRLPSKSEDRPYTLEGKEAAFFLAILLGPSPFSRAEEYTINYQRLNDTGFKRHDVEAFIQEAQPASPPRPCSPAEAPPPRPAPKTPASTELPVVAPKPAAENIPPIPGEQESEEAKQAEKLCEDPDDLKCWISTELFIDPVMASDGQTYERAEIEKWFFVMGKRTSPNKHTPLPEGEGQLTLTTNQIVRKFVGTHIDKTIHDCRALIEKCKPLGYASTIHKLEKRIKDLEELAKERLELTKKSQ